LVTHSRSKARILVVDDDEEILAMMERALNRHGFEVFLADSADAALALAGEHSFDAALVDLVMPGRDGRVLADALRRQFPGMPVGLITGYARSPLVADAERSGVRLFSKPVIIQEIVEFLQAEIS
jgi:DNA-binding NtrC family response regulator